MGLIVISSLFYIVVALDLTLNKRLQMLFCLMLSVLIVISGGAASIPDYSAYHMMYDHVVDYPNWLYGVISDLFHNNGISFNQFRLIWALVAMFLIFYPVRKMLKKYQQIIFIIIFVTTQFCIETIQVRNFMIVGLFTISFYILLLQKKYSVLLYGVIMLVGTQIHQVAYVFLPIVFMPVVLRYKRLKYVGLVILLFAVIALFQREIILFFIERYSSCLLYEKLFFYFAHDKMRLGYVLAFTLHICVIIILHNFYGHAVKLQHIPCNCSFNFHSILNFTQWLNIYMLIVWPLIRIDMTNFRFLRIISPMNTIVILLGFKYLSPYINSSNKWILRIVFTLYLALYFYLAVLKSSPDGNVFFPVFCGKNWIYSSLRQI